MEMRLSDRDVRFLAAVFGRAPNGEACATREQWGLLINSGALRRRDGATRIDLRDADMYALARTLAEAIVRHGGARPDKLGHERFVDSLVKMGFERRISDREVDLLFKKFAVDGKWLGTGEVAQMIRSGWLVFDGRGFAYGG